jgi:hypothetical protein
MAGGCSSPPIECNPPIAAGTRFKVTVVGETAESEKCHIVRLGNTFEIQASQHDSSMDANCSLTPAYWAPQAQGVNVIRCTPSASNMLGTNCEMQYTETRCAGLIDFYFYAPTGSAVNWSAQRIEGARFRIKDYLGSCWPNQAAGCLDEYNVILERIL